MAPKSFQSLRSRTISEMDGKRDEESVKSAGVNSPLPSDEDELEDPDQNTRFADSGNADSMETKAFKPVYKKQNDGSYTLNTEEVIVQEQMLIENVMDKLKKIISQQTAGTVKFADGTTQKVDVQTATVLLKVHGALNPNNQTKMAQFIAKSRPGFMKMLDFSWKQVNFSRGNG